MDQQSHSMVRIARLIATRFLSVEDNQHSHYVMSQVEGNRRKILAVLHDVIEGSEDRDYILKILAVFGKYVVADLLLLTHEEGVRYRKYIQKLAESGRADAIAVKLADLEHNMDLSRLEKVEQYHLDRNKKYEKAHRILTEALTLL